MKQLLSQGYSSCLVVPLLAASVDLGSTSASSSLRDNIELDCRGSLSYQNDGRYLLEFAEIKSSLDGKNGVEDKISSLVRQVLGIRGVPLTILLFLTTSLRNIKLALSPFMQCLLIFVKLMTPLFALFCGKVFKAWVFMAPLWIL